MRALVQRFIEIFRTPYRSNALSASHPPRNPSPSIEDAPIPIGGPESHDPIKTVEPTSMIGMVAKDLDAHFEHLGDEITQMQRQIRLRIEQRLRPFTGCEMGSIESNQNLVRQIHGLLERHGLRLICPECGHPAILRFSQRGDRGGRGSSAIGVFVFDHTIDRRRTFHGGSRMMPTIRLTVRPPRNPRSASAVNRRTANSAVADDDR